jgi:hypothetical protein
MTMVGTSIDATASVMSSRIATFGHAAFACGAAFRLSSMTC